MLKHLFSALGLGEKEITVFLKMMELGAQPVSVIARHLHMPRSSVYAVLERLRELNVIEEFSRRGLSYVRCVAVDSIEDLLEDKKRTYEIALKNLEENLPKLHQLENRLSITPIVEFFEGKRAVKKMYENILGERDFCAFFNPESVKKKMPEYLYKIAENLLKINGTAKEILVDNKVAKDYQSRFNSERHKVKLFPDSRIFHADWIIGKDKIYMISYGENDISGTEIESASIVHAQREIFGALWARI